MANEVGVLLAPGMTLALYGEMGAGKTTFMQGLGRALGIRQRITSPTFSLVSEYSAPRFKLVHLDLYRLDSARDLLDLGFQEYLESGAVVAVEWAEKAAELMPRNTLHIRFALGEDEYSREIEVVRGEGSGWGC